MTDIKADMYSWAKDIKANKVYLGNKAKTIDRY
jgi:hypothetical protein